MKKYNYRGFQILITDRSFQVEGHSVYAGSKKAIEKCVDVYLERAGEAKAEFENLLKQKE